MNDPVKIERFFCNSCKRKTKHILRGEHERCDDVDDAGAIWFAQRMLIVECCGCENLALVKLTSFSEDVVDYFDPLTGEEKHEEAWEEVIYPPVTYRNPPKWSEDVPDAALRDISKEIYQAMQTGSRYLATFGSRTLLDRLIVLTVGDQGSFGKGLAALQKEGKLSQHERQMLEPALQAGHAAAHRGWAPTDEQLAIILDTVEGLIHRLLVLPKLAEELEEAVPARNRRVECSRSVKVEEKLDAISQDLRAVYEALVTALTSCGDDVTVHRQKHYIAFRRRRNFASLQIYNRRKVLKIYLNLDPDSVDEVEGLTRDVRQIGHFGTGDLEVTIKSQEDVELVRELIMASYEAS